MGFISVRDTSWRRLEIHNITAGPPGALMYHCHAQPTSKHIRNGMYGIFIVDPKDKPLPPAKEFYIVTIGLNPPDPLHSIRSIIY